MKIESIKVGLLECNCYLVIKDNYVIVIDPGDDYDKIINKIKDRKVVAILITHRHFDHIQALSKLEEKYRVKVYEKSNLEEKEYEIFPFKFEVIYTKGHSPDSVTYYFKEDKIMFVGDFIFSGSIGRCDLEGGNYKEMQDSISKIKKYDDEIIIYPGHGNKTTLKEEKTNNIYFQKEKLW